MAYEVSLVDVESRRTGIHRGCRNIMLYLNGVPNVEVGVLLDQPCPQWTGVYCLLS